MNGPAAQPAPNPLTVTFVFVGRADPLATLYEGVGGITFVATDVPPGTAAALTVPGIGDRVTLRMHPGPDIRTFRCTGRHFDFSEAGAPFLTVELDMA